MATRGSVKELHIGTDDSEEDEEGSGLHSSFVHRRRRFERLRNRASWCDVDDNRERYHVDDNRERYHGTPASSSFSSSARLSLTPGMSSASRTRSALHIAGSGRDPEQHRQQEEEEQQQQHRDLSPDSPYRSHFSNGHVEVSASAWISPVVRLERMDADEDTEAEVQSQTMAGTAATAAAAAAAADVVDPVNDEGLWQRSSSPVPASLQFVNPEMPGYVGFANLPNQVHRKSVKKGFEFTLLVIGESGLGKSTLINSLFLTDLYPDRQIPKAADKIEKTVKLEASSVEIEERGVRLRLTVVDTPGFGDSINNADCFKPIIKYIDDQFEKYLNDESGLNRRNIIDNRVHCCFYFINPAGHGLKPLDVSFMKSVDHKVNIVPVIAKSDTLTKPEVVRLKRKILEQIASHGIQIYTLPDCDTDEDEDYKEQCKQLKAAVPFAVVGSSQVIEVRGRKVRGRMYPWGVVEVENPEHCDFIKLRTMLITHMQDLQEVTQDIHYENFRSERLAISGSAGPRKISKNRRGSTDVVEKEEKLGEKERQLKEKDDELRKMQEMLSKMQKEMSRQKHSSAAAPSAPPPSLPHNASGASGPPPSLPSQPPPTVNNNSKGAVNGRVNGHGPAPLIRSNDV